MIVIDKDITNDDEDVVGSIQGYVVNKSENNWKNYLKSELGNEAAINFLVEKIEASELTEIAIIKNVNVFDEHRGHGYGNDLMNVFFDTAEQAHIFILMADKSEGQSDGFSLVTWYEGFDFQEVYSQEDISCMVWDNNSFLCEPHTDLTTEFQKKLKELERNNSSVQKNRMF